MMAKILYMVGFLSLSVAAALLFYSGRQWSQSRRTEDGESEMSLCERFEALQNPGADRGGIEPPLIKEAKAFALYLNPPPPPPPKEPSPPKASAPPPRPTSTAPKFRLLSISYYQSEPQRSLAMVSEPGKGAYWISEGAQLGHLVVERINREGIVYRDGAQVHEMPITVKATVELAQRRPESPVAERPVQRIVQKPVEPPVRQTVKQTVRSSSHQNIRPNVRFLNGSP